MKFPDAFDLPRHVLQQNSCFHLLDSQNHRTGLGETSGDDPCIKMKVKQDIRHWNSHYCKHHLLDWIPLLISCTSFPWNFWLSHPFTELLEFRSKKFILSSLLYFFFLFSSLSVFFYFFFLCFFFFPGGASSFSHVIVFPSFSSSSFFDFFFFFFYFFFFQFFLFHSSVTG